LYDRQKFTACKWCREAKLKCVSDGEDSKCKRCQKKKLDCILSPQDNFFKKKNKRLPVAHEPEEKTQTDDPIPKKKNTRSQKQHPIKTENSQECDQESSVFTKKTSRCKKEHPIKTEDSQKSDLETSVFTKELHILTVAESTKVLPGVQKIEVKADACFDLLPQKMDDINSEKFWETNTSALVTDAVDTTDELLSSQEYVFLDSLVSTNDHQMLPYQPSPVSSRLPAESQLIGSSCGYFLEAFYKRSSRMAYFVDASVLQHAIDKIPTHYCWHIGKTKDYSQALQEIGLRNALRACLLSAVGIGAFQIKALSRQLIQELKDQMLNAVQTCEVYDKIFSTVEGCMALQNVILFMRLVRCSFSNDFHIIKSLAEKLRNCLQNQKSSGSSSLAQFEIGQKASQFMIFLKEHWPEAEDCVSRSISEHIMSQQDLQKEFPLVLEIVESIPESENPESCQPLIQELLRECTSNKASVRIAITTYISFIFPVPIITRAVFGSKDISVQRKRDILAEAVRLPDVILKMCSVEHNQRGNTMRFSYNFLQLLNHIIAGDQGEIKASLFKLAALFSRDSLLCSIFFSFEQLSHWLHIITIAFSHLEMHEDFNNFRNALRANTISVGIDEMAVPECCPLSLHGICEDTICMNVWKCLQNHCSNDDSSALQLDLDKALLAL